MIKEHNAGHHKPFRIRRARVTDARALSALAGDMVAELHRETPRLDEAGWLIHGIGSKRVFDTWVAETEAGVVAFAFCYPGFDLQTASRGTHLSDLFVAGACRGRGIGRGLFLKVAMETLRQGGEWVAWTVLGQNAEAHAFYRALGAEPVSDLRHMAVGRAALWDLLAREDALP